jgi:sugar O-acyltransferase (sialic acid O-acetyltransferase NeuD family)
MRKLAIIGWEEGTAGQVDSWISNGLILKEYKVECFIEPSDIDPCSSVKRIKRAVSTFNYPTNGMYRGKPLHTTARWASMLLEKKISDIVITVPDSKNRDSIMRIAKEASLNLTTVIHPTALVSSDALISKGVILHPRVFIGYCAEVRSGVIVNTGSIIEHHCMLDECATIDPGVTFAGNVTIGKYSKIHTGATIINRINIGQNSVVGAGAVVIRDVKDNDIVVGCPAKPLTRTKSQI